jgi:hypothetical protein
MKYKQYLVYSSVPVVGFWFIFAAQFSMLNRILPANETRLIAEINQHEMRWCVGWLVTAGLNTLFQTWFWRKDRREANLHKPKAKQSIKVIKTRIKS